ncbi:type VI secretion system Vgr family protein [Polyangium jinanense]|uniref:Type VI secretion system tip protein VgrG n=1 Tax=Polyangium jinanense TaxID=2829994 RepID=A0A9X4ARF6_9BACT|nr:type VI secretion system tip protein TssI/VgrG [Polyangium jinanense]MDC3953971.1 type VI secretion system tip protein VgrG [Polyangium jinanense]MDC3957816.1 type VI secretion system tip protein VgrG [Polyangium jinanense]MDC3978902.1 type VI secretion system tip protein VgrG [Polyangium jinanense]MDC3982073.1 type VI secretion system tip protein VgrG [Polyangium jinanense]
MELAFAEVVVTGIEVRRVLSLRGEEALSTLFRYEVEVEVELPLPDVDVVIGAEATLTLRDQAHKERVVTGVVAEASARALDSERGRATLVLRPMMWRQSLGRDCYASQDVRVQDVVDDVLADYTGKYRWALTRSYPRYPYRAQYREDDWTYVSRLLEEEGIYYWFDHDAGSITVFSDNSTAAPEMPGGALLPWVRESALQPKQDAVTQLGSVSAASTGRFAAKSYDLKRPLVPIKAQAGAGRHEVYDAPGGGTGMEAILAVRVRDQRDAAVAARAGVMGLSTSVRPYPGVTLEIDGHPVGKLNGRYLVTRVEVDGDEHQPCDTRFWAIRAEVAFRPERATPEAKQAGLQLGQVIGPDGQEVHPDELARVRTILHWDRLGPRNEKGGTWMRVAQRAAPGSMLFPRMGWNVATFNEEGGVDAPSVIWRIHDGQRLPEYKLPGNMTRVVWKTATVPADGTANEIYFEDRMGAEEMFINASRDMNYIVLDSRWESIQNDSTRTVAANHDLTIHASQEERVIRDQQIRIGGNETLTVSGLRIKSVSGNETETVGGSRTIRVGDAHRTSVKGDRTLSVGGSLIEITPNNINRTSRDMVTVVGGSVVKIAGEDVSEVARKDSVQVIAGSKIEVAKKDRALDVNKVWNEEVGGSIVCVSNEKYLDNADTTSTWKVTSSVLGSAPVVHIEAVESIRFSCGSSVLTMTTEAITITTPSLDLSGATFDADSGIIEHN